MNSDIIIETDRLILRQYKLSDVDDIVEGLNNLNVSKWMAFVPYPYTKEDAIKYITNSIEKNLYNFAIVLKSENKVIGSTQISNISTDHGTAGGGIWINEKYQGHGYGTEAWGARIKFAFENLGLRRLENGYFKDNISSFKMQEKFGYKNEGIKRKKFISMVTGNIEDEYITGLLKEEWIDYKEVFYTCDLCISNEIILEKPSIKHKEQVIKFIEEVEQFEPNERVRYSGFSSLEDYKENYEEWLKKIEIYTKKEALPEGRVMSDVFFSVRKSDNKIVGIINIRHDLNDYLYKYGGHIGYSIVPSERRKGYAYKQLLLGLEYCKTIDINRVLITCLDYNIGSSKTIEKAGGKLENIVKNEDENETLKRYWISLE